jgi:hypothetical protein
MGVRQQRPNQRVQGRRDDGDRVYTRTDHMTEHTRDTALQLVKQVAQMTDNALGVDTRWFYYYKRRTSGRRCTCALGENNTPSSTCKVCYGTGIVGGYDKYGTRSETLDSTFPGFSFINVTTNSSPLPSTLVLEDGATRGIVRGTLKLVKNTKFIDSFSIASKGQVQVRMKPSGSSIWSIASTASVTPMLSADSIDIEIQLDRERPTDPTPIFLKVYLRYGLLPKDEIKIPGDLPPNTESVSLQEYGYDEQFGTVQIVMGSAGKNRTNRITTFTIDDFLYYIERGRHWKLTEVKPNYALGFYTSFDLTARWVQNYERYKDFPV